MKSLLFSFVLCLLLHQAAPAQSRAEKEVATAVEHFKALLENPDKAQLEKLVANEMSFGHSSGKIEDKATMIDKLVSGKTDWSKVSFTEQSIQIIDETAIVRHSYQGELVSGKTPEQISMVVLLVWHKQKGQWQLLARQAVKL